MSTELDRLAVSGNFLDRLQALEREVDGLKRQRIQARELSEISEDMGEIRGGRIVAEDELGNIRLILSAVNLFSEYGIEAHLAGLDEDGFPTFYLSADDGSGVFANGMAKLTNEGIIVNGVTMAWLQVAALLDGTGERRLRMGIFNHPGRDDKLVSGLKQSGDYLQLETTGTIVEGELLGTNKGFELGDITQFTLTRTPSGALAPTYSLYTTSPITGTYSLRLTISITSDPEPETETNAQSYTLETDKVAVSAGDNVTFSLKTKQIYYSGLYITTWTYKARAYFYNAAGEIVSYETITETRPTSTTRTDTGTFTVPGNATQCLIKVYVNAVVQSGTGGYLTWQVLYDDFSINGESVQAGSASWNLVPREETLFIDNGLKYLAQDGSIYKVVLVKQGIQAPGALTAAVSATAGNVDVGTHSYKVTFFDGHGETEASVKSNVVTVSSSAKQVNLTAIPKGGEGTLTRRIYRTTAGDTGDWFFVAEIMDNTSTTYTDDVADADLGDATAPGVNTSGSRPSAPDSWFGAFTQFQAFHVDGSRFEPSSGRSLSSTSLPSGASLLPGSEAADGDYYICYVWLMPGTYSFLVNFAKGSSFGKADLYVDGVKVNATTLDMYAAGASYANDWNVGNISVSYYSLHELKILINGKNASSTDYRIQMGAMSMNRTA